MTRLEDRLRQLPHCIFVLAVLSTWTASQAAGKDDASLPRVSLQLVCAPDRPLVHPGESVTVRAWVTDDSGKPVSQSVALTWSASTGRIAGEEVATWSFGQAAGGFGGVIDARAKAIARHDALGSAACEVRVYIASPAESPNSARSATLSARAFLLPDQDAPDGYGLYSYLLFDTPPNGDEQRRRYLKAIEAYLLVLQPLEEMERHRRRSELNLTLMPVKRNIELPNDLSDPNQAAQAAQRVLAVYDYARAQVLLADLGRSVRSGPYLASKTPADVGDQGALLFFDMSHVMPQLVWDWVSVFCSLTAQEHSWTDVTLTKLALNTRNVIAVGARTTPEVVSGLEKWIRLTKAQ